MSSKNNYAPILVSVYDRLDTFSKCIDALQKNDLSVDSELFIVSDGPKDKSSVGRIDKVRAFARNINGFKKVNLIFRDENFGSFKSITEAERQIIKEFGRIILLEDDIIASPGFLRFLNSALEYYESNKTIFSVSSYVHPINYISKFNGYCITAPFHCPWGYATWLDRYDQINPNLNPLVDIKKDKYIYKYLTKYSPFILKSLIDDFKKNLGYIDVRISTQMMLKKMVSIYPAKSLSFNIGFDGSGERMKKESRTLPDLIDHYNVIDWVPISDEQFDKKFTAYKNHSIKSYLLRLMLWLRLI